MTSEEFYNLGVGEIFTIGCRKFEVIEIEMGIGCKDCAFYDIAGDGCLNFEEAGFKPCCCWEQREDGVAVIFVEVEE